MSGAIPPKSLDDALIHALPSAAYYISDFISSDEEAYLLQKINDVPLPTWRTLTHRRLQAHPSPLSSSNTLLDAPLPAWLSEPIIHRLLSLQASPTDPDRKDQSFDSAIANGCSNGGDLTKRKTHVFGDSPHGKPNHVLINEYLPGQGIMPHEDGDAYWPVVCTVSLGAPIVYDAYPKTKSPGQQEKKWRILQEPRSLLVTTGEMYRNCLHGIESVDVDENVRESEAGVVNWDFLRKEVRHQMEKEGGRNVRGTRISLTFRDVIKVKKLGKGLAFLAK